MATSFAIFGVNEFAARLPVALASLLWFAVTALIACEVAGRLAAPRAAAILGTTLGVFLFGHWIAGNPFASLFQAATFWFVLLALRDSRMAGRWMFWGWVSMAFGVLSDGMEAVVLPLAVAAMVGLAEPLAHRSLARIFQLAGPVAFAAIAGGWLGWIESRQPGFVWQYLVEAELRRFWHDPSEAEMGLLPFWVQHLGLWMPWVVFAPSALAAALHGPLRRQAPMERTHAVLLGCWVLFVWVLGSLEIRHPNATLASWSAAAVLLAVLIPRLAEMPSAWSVFPSALIAIMGAALLILGLYLRSTLAPEMNTADHPLGMVVPEMASAGTWLALSPLLCAAGTAWCLAGAMAAWFGHRHRVEPMIGALAAGMIAFNALAATVLTKLDSAFSSAAIAQALNARSTSESLIVCEGSSRENSSLTFYLDRKVHWLDLPPFVGPGTLSPEEFHVRWRYAPSVYFILDPLRLPQWEDRLHLSPAQSVPIAGTPFRILIWNASR